jgi:RimJ/RimL family protein N-acetyltransferase
VINPFRIGAAIYLRPLERADAPLLQQWINDPEVTRTLLMYRPVSRAAEERWIDELDKTDREVVLGIAIGAANDKLIGATGLHQIDYKNRHAQFGIVIGDRHEWNKGYGTEATALMVAYAFETLNLNRVWLHVYETNPAGIKAYEKAGFRKEGVLRQDTFRDGRYLDAIAMAILRADWEATRA